MTPPFSASGGGGGGGGWRIKRSPCVCRRVEFMPLLKDWRCVSLACG